MAKKDFLIDHRQVLLNMYNSSDGYFDIDTPEDMEPESVRNVAIAIIGVLSIAGIIGNSLVLYVFTRQKQKLSSTIFILTLAGTDLITSMVTMPYTIALECLRYNVGHDAICKIYHILTTTTIPFSASVMVAIAVDRYLCIVHPFKNAMTIRRAKISVVVLAIGSVCLGMPLSLSYGVYKREVLTSDIFSGIIDQVHFNDGSNMSSLEGAISNISEVHIEPTNETLHSQSEDVYFMRATGICFKNLLIFGEDFFNVYQKVYSAYFAICAVIVIILYVFIYRSVLHRRRKRLHLSNSCCGFLGPIQGIQGPQVETNEHEQTEFTMLNNTAKDKDKSPTSARAGRKVKEESFRLEPREACTKNGGIDLKEAKDVTSDRADRESLVRPTGISRAKLEKLRMANTKTAVCLSVVAVTYIVAFLPAWLMALRIIPMNPIVFFMYFTYNVANPIIYAFLNQSFRNHLQSLMKC
ncbi:neuropeptide Y receptor type 4-like isoform X2 [Mya arenaria]|uniref:neuropeptide Y receptor type 4-like isoform X2 n=1 Tax=Mya arenaria TaxID=6604 RepID=UPI0022E39F7F|nr:neuropeptide Y receptor type 4-like isoform X2 [Mya arenaria]